jgi:hypothetical protein
MNKRNLAVSIVVALLPQRLACFAQGPTERMVLVLHVPTISGSGCIGISFYNSSNGSVAHHMQIPILFLRADRNCYAFDSGRLRRFLVLLSYCPVSRRNVNTQACEGVGTQTASQLVRAVG